MHQQQFVAIEKIGQGALNERFSQEFQKVLANVFDLNTDPTAKRSISIKIEFKPNETRDFMNVVASATSKLAPHEATHTTFRIGKLGDRIEATEMIVDQPSLLEPVTHPEVNH